MRKPWGVIVLIVVFGWAIGRGVMSLLPSSTDFVIYSAAGLSLLFVALTLAATVLEVTTLYFLVKPKPLGLRIGLTAVFVWIMQLVTSTVLVMADLEGAKAAYIASRNARGLSIRPELYDALFTSNAMIAILAFSLLPYAGVAFLLFRNRGYFGQRDSG